MLLIMIGFYEMENEYIIVCLYSTFRLLNNDELRICKFQIVFNIQVSMFAVCRIKRIYSVGMFII